MMNENVFNSNCFICSCHLSDPQYNMTSSITTHTKVNLVDFIVFILNLKIIISESDSICEQCFVTINELDFVQTQSRMLREKLLGYLNGNLKTETIGTSFQETEFKCDYCDDVCTSQEELELVHNFNCKSRVCDSDVKVNEENLEYMSVLTKCDNEATVLQNIVVNAVDVSHQDQKENDESLMVKHCGKRKPRIAKTLKPHKCDQCNKTWKTLSLLKIHMASHSNTRPFICEICGQSYKHKSALDIHVGMHNGINPFTCEYCHKSFTQKGALQRHLPIHTGECPFQCDQCGKRFVHHTSFMVHSHTHTGKKDYKCSLCGAALISGSHLKRHMRAHTGEKRFECATCGKRFAERYNLVSHQKVHNNGHGLKSDKMEKCYVCPSSFHSVELLKDHMTKEHTIVLQAEGGVNMGDYVS